MPQDLWATWPPSWIPCRSSWGFCCSIRRWLVGWWRRETRIRSCCWKTTRGRLPCPCYPMIDRGPCLSRSSLDLFSWTNVSFLIFRSHPFSRRWHYKIKSLLIILLEVWSVARKYVFNPPNTFPSAPNSPWNVSPFLRSCFVHSSYRVEKVNRVGFRLSHSHPYI
jgi:hypothetical protein